MLILFFQGIHYSTINEFYNVTKDIYDSCYLTTTIDIIIIISIISNYNRLLIKTV